MSDTETCVTDQLDAEMKAVLLRVSRSIEGMRRRDPSASVTRIDITALNPTADGLDLAMQELAWLHHYPEISKEDDRTIITVAF